MYNVSYEDMWNAYIDCRKRKKKRPGAKRYGVHALFNTIKLTDEINAVYRLTATNLR